MRIVGPVSRPGSAADPGPAIALQPANAGDLPFVARVYGRAMGDVLRRAGLDVAQQAALLAAQWRPAEIRIITAAGRRVGWVQVAAAPDAWFIRNFCIDPDWQKLGIGSVVLHRLIAEAARDGAALSLGVAKANPAMRLYQRHGFRVTHDDAAHDYMRREPSVQVTVPAVPEHAPAKRTGRFRR